MSVLHIAAFVVGFLVGFAFVLGLALARISRLADDALELMERPVFIGSGFLDVGAVFDWPERPE